MSLLKGLTVIDPESEYHLQKVDLLISDGTIHKIGKNISASKDTSVYHFNDALISQGWCDVGTQIGDPGFEYREDAQSLSMAAAAGGYTHLAIFPNTFPCADSKSHIQYMQGLSDSLATNFWPIGAITKSCEEQQLAELYDMHLAGAVAFSNGRHAIQNSSLLLKALQYITPFDGLIIQRPMDDLIRADGMVHEGKTAVKYGLKGISYLAELCKLKSDIEICKYAESKILFHTISTHQAIEEIINWRQKHKDIYSSVAIMNLVESEEAIQDFDPNYKVLPPLRSELDRQTLVAAVESGHIDIVVSNHEPYESDQKDIEFSRAKYGAIGLETCFSLLNAVLTYDKNKATKIVNLLSTNPRKILNITSSPIQVGQEADLTLFDLHSTWTYDESLSKSTNSPYLGQQLRGKVHGIFHKKRSYLSPALSKS